MTADDLSCAELVALVTDYYEAALTPSERRRFELHVAGCEGCANYLSQMRTTLELTGRLAEGDLPAETRAALLGAFRGWKPAA